MLASLTMLATLTLSADFLIPHKPHLDARPHPGFGNLAAPAYSLDRCACPVVAYQPQPGDVILLSHPNLLSNLLYRIAFTRSPGHSAVVVRMADGQLGLYEAGVDVHPVIQFNVLDRRLHGYPGTLWVRRRAVPLTPEQDRLLTEFAEQSTNRGFALGRFANQLTPFRARGPLRTFLFGRPRGPGKRYVCSEAVVEALAYARAIDPEAARPAATYPEDLFFDHSRNRFLNLHPPLVPCWEAPALWCRSEMRCGPHTSSMRTGLLQLTR